MEIWILVIGGVALVLFVSIFLKLTRNRHTKKMKTDADSTHSSPSKKQGLVIPLDDSIKKEDKNNIYPLW